MGKYIKLFKTYAEYEAFVASDEYIEPHISYCSEDGCIQYNKVVRKIKIQCVSTFSVCRIYDDEGNVILTLNTDESGYIDSLYDGKLYVSGCNTIQNMRNYNGGDYWNGDTQGRYFEISEEQLNDANYIIVLSDEPM